MTHATPVAGERARPEWLRRNPRAWIAAVVTVCFGAFMGQLDASIVTLTYHSIGHDFDAGLGIVQFVSLSYLVALGGLLVPFGRVSDGIGRKRVYLWGFALFTVASAGCALAPDLAVLSGLRALQGAGAAMLQANSVAIVATAAPAARLRTALGVQAAAQALGLALGPTLGGLLVQVLGWRWVFAVNAPVGVVALIAGRFLLPRTRTSGDRPSRVRTVLKAQGVRSGLAGAMLAYLLLFGPVVLVPAVLQAGGTSPIRAGAVAAALPIGFAVGALFLDRSWPQAWSPGRRGSACAGLTVAGLAGVVVGAAHPVGWGVALAVTGLGLGAFTPVNNAQVMAAAPRSAAAVAGGLVSAARAVGTAAGTVLVAATLPAARDGRAAAALLLAVAAGAVGMAGAAGRRRGQVA